jgi:hypothetical protein
MRRRRVGYRVKRYAPLGTVKTILVRLKEDVAP